MDLQKIMWFIMWYVVIINVIKIGGCVVLRLGIGVYTPTNLYHVH